MCVMHAYRMRRKDFVQALRLNTHTSHPSKLACLSQLCLFLLSSTRFHLAYSAEMLILTALFHQVPHAAYICYGKLTPNFRGVTGFFRGLVPMARTSSMGALRTSCVHRLLNSSARHRGSGRPSSSSTFVAAPPALAICHRLLYIPSGAPAHARIRLCCCYSLCASCLGGAIAALCGLCILQKFLPPIGQQLHKVHCAGRIVRVQGHLPPAYSPSIPHTAAIHGRKHCRWKAGLLSAMWRQFQ